MRFESADSSACWERGSWNQLAALLVEAGVNKGRNAMMKAMFSWLGRLFAPRGDNFKAQLMADLGIKR